ncbi:MAG: signal peptidase II [Vallitaleaceae bacterium]|jgi:signal peptidase II|nr:signal peptidase II [Vallitaleaceae bacterium]
MFEIIAIIFLISLDQIVKYLTVLHLQGQAHFVVLDKVFEFVYVENRGAAFGILQNQQGLFKVFTGIFIVIAIYVLFKKMPRTKHYMLLRVTAVLFIAGGIGNLIDRVRLNYVIDTFYFKLIDFPVFNVADSCVVIGSILFVLLLLFKYKDTDFEFLNFRSNKKDVK